MKTNSDHLAVQLAEGSEPNQLNGNVPVRELEEIVRKHTRVGNSWDVPDVVHSDSIAEEAYLLGCQHRGELLEALKYARRMLKPADHDTAYVDAVIAKATGEQP